MESSKGFFRGSPGEMMKIDEHIFQMGWFNRHLAWMI